MKSKLIASLLALLSAPLAARAADAPTYSKEIAPIIYQNCSGCHRHGEVAPFPLMQYSDAKKRANQIADIVNDRIMPPWKAEKGHGDFLYERRLTDEQIQQITAWAKAGAPEGDATKAPPAPKFPEGWQLGEPDMVVKMTEPYTVKAEGRDEFRCFVIPLDLKEDKYVTAIDFRPGNRKIVHHALFFLDSSGQARKLDAADPGPGYGRTGGIGFLPTGGLGGWAPGVQAQYLPNGIARTLRKGSDLVVQVHFHPSGKEEAEQSSIGLYFSKTPPQHITTSFPKASRPLDIPAGEKNYVINDTFNVPTDVTLIGITPHAHLLCKEIKVDASFPDGSQKPLIWIKRWDWDWQDQYLYKDQIKIPAGTKVSLKYVYDNSADNPGQPNNPPKRVRWGEQTSDEMAITFFQIVVERNGGGLLGLLAGGGGGRRAGNNNPPPAVSAPTTKPAAPATPAATEVDLEKLPPQIQQMILRRFDKNGNGKLDADEKEAAKDALDKLLGAGGL